MEKRRKSPATISKIKKKMTKEQLQLAILRKKECDTKALTIVERLLEPDVDPAWLVESLKNINRCHMEDVIEERAIIKLCGYVLCPKPLVVVYNQRYHISLKNKKVYDIIKRKNFCSSSCFGASNYLLEQMLTSPLWLREQEEIPTFRIFHKQNQGSSMLNVAAHREQLDISASRHQESQDAINQDGQLENVQLQDETPNKTLGYIDNFVLEAVKEMATENVDDKQVKTQDKRLQAHAQDENEYDQLITNSPTKGNIIKSETETISNRDIQEDEKSFTDDDIEQCVYPIENEINDLNSKCSSDLKHDIESEDIIEQSSYPVQDRYYEADCTSKLDSFNESTIAQNIERDKVFNDLITKVHKKKKQVAHKMLADINLAARIESSFHEWFTNQTVDYLFGGESAKKRLINAIEMQENHRILCGKLDRLQVKEERENAEISGKTALKPVPHFSVLKDEGEKLDLKVRAFYEGKITFEELQKSSADEETSDNAETFLPLVDSHAPQLLRRKIVLEKLDQVLPDLLRTLVGNNDVYGRESLNYSSGRCAAVKALVHTFSLSAKNIIFKAAEWTLVGLVIIKMLSLSDRYLASLLATKQANLYISMILTAYKLDPNYLNLLVSSFNPNMNLR